MEKTLIERFQSAYSISKRVLDNNYGPLGIYAGSKVHKQYWARDSFITSFGSCAVGDTDIVKKNLELFIKYQRSDGHIPARVEENYHVLALLSTELKRKYPFALHKQSQPWATEVVDSNSWFIISAANYIRYSNNDEWLNSNAYSLISAAEWLINRIHNNGLLYESYIANWSDCNLKKGYVLYNNVLAWKAFLELGTILGHRGFIYLKKAEEMKESIVKSFWDEELGYLIDWIDLKSKKHKYFYSDGNLLAIWFGLIESNNAESILKFIQKVNLDVVPIATGYPRLDWWNDIFNQLFFPMYRTRNIFTWLGCVLVLARLKLGQVDSSLNALQKIADTIIKYNTCHEILTPPRYPCKSMVL